MILANQRQSTFLVTSFFSFYYGRPVRNTSSTFCATVFIDEEYVCALLATSKGRFDLLLVFHMWCGTFCRVVLIVPYSCVEICILD